MNFSELKENEPLRVIEVSNHTKIPSFNIEERLHPSISENKQIHMKIFTDGEIASESAETTESIKEFFIGEKRYNKVDTLKTKNISFKNHSYVIVYLIAAESRIFRNIGGIFDIIKDVSVYLANSKDKASLKNVKKIIKQIETLNNSDIYSSPLKMISSQENNTQQFECEQISSNVYSLKLKK